MDMHLKDAEALARKAHQLDPKDGYVLDTLGWILYKQGRFPEAIRMLEAAFSYQSGVSVIAEHLGDAYMKQALVENNESTDTPNTTALVLLYSEILSRTLQSSVVRTPVNAKGKNSTTTFFPFWSASDTLFLSVSKSEN